MSKRRAVWQYPPPGTRCCWRVRCYDRRDKVTSSFVIEDRTEHEAENEAMGEQEVRQAADWTMTEAKPRRKRA